jgi:hypothetical protein
MRQGTALGSSSLGPDAGSLIFRGGIITAFSAPVTPRSLTPAPPAPGLSRPQASPRLASIQRSDSRGIKNLLVRGMSKETNRSNLASLTSDAAGIKPPPSINTYAPKWWVPDPKETTAIAEFDARHRQHLLRANRVRDNLRANPTSLDRERALDRSIWELGANRYFERDNLGGVRTYAKKEKKKKKKVWKMLESIWVPRRKSSPGGDFYDTGQTKGKAFASDWLTAVERTKIDNKIIRANDKLERKEADPLMALHDAMVQYADVILQTFTFYASQGAGNDIFAIGKNSYLQFVRDLSLVDNDTMGLRDQDLQLIFEGVNASASKEDEYNSKHALMRWEFVGTLVQLILAKYIVSKLMPIVEAVHKFFKEDLMPNVPFECFQDSNSFRSDFCYIEEVDIVLKQYEPSLRNLFNAFAFGTGAIGDKLLTTKLLDFNEYLDFINRLDVIDPYVTLREVRLNFVWARMLVIDETATAGRKKIIQLTFEDFLELLVRFAYLFALPNDQDIFDLGVQHAGEYLEWLEGHPDEQDSFRRARSKNMGDKLDQPIGHKMRHFIEWMLYTVRGGEPSEKSGPSAITKKDAERFHRGLVRRVKKESEEDGSPMSSPGREMGGSPGGDDDEVGYMIDKSSAAAQLDQDSALRSQMRITEAED